MSTLDHELRDKLLATARRAEQDTASDGASDALVAAIAARGPGIVRAARRRRQVIRIGGAAASALSLAAAVYLGLTRPAPSDDAARPIAHAPAACSARDAAAIDVPTTLVAGEVLDLGFVALEPGSTSRVELGAMTGCYSEIRLVDGSVTVHARDLEGGSLVVTTPLGKARVLGTIFSVSVSADVLEVEVAEGIVEVRSRRASGGVVRLPRGQAVAIEGPLARATTAPEAHTAAMRAEVAAWRAIAHASAPSVLEPADASASSIERSADDRAPATSPALARSRGEDLTGPTVESAETSIEPAEARLDPPSDDELARRAGAATRAGDIDEARRLYRQLASGTGPTAEAALVRLARLELDAGRPDVAATILAERERRGAGYLAAEAAWLRVEIASARGDGAGARAAAEALIARHAGTAQASAARRYLEEHAADE